MQLWLALQLVAKATCLLFHSLNHCDADVHASELHIPFFRKNGENSK